MSFTVNTEVLGFVCEFKKQSLFSTYDIRYCVVNINYFQIYKNEKEYHHHKHSSRKVFQISLQNAKYETIESKQHPYVLCINVQNAVYNLSFQSSNDFKVFQEAVENAKITGKNNAQEPSEFKDNDQKDLNQKYKMVLQQLRFPIKKIVRMLECTPVSQKYDAIQAANAISYTQSIPSLTEKYNFTTKAIAIAGENVKTSDVDEHWDIILLRYPTLVTTEILANLRNEIFLNEWKWTKEFVDEQGLTLLVTLIPKNMEFPEMQKHILECFLAICEKIVDNEKVGLQSIAKHCTAIQGITDLFDTNDLQVRLLIIKLLSAICWHSSCGFKRVLFALETYQSDNNLSSIWYPIILQIKPMLALIINDVQQQSIETEKEYKNPETDMDISTSSNDIILMKSDGGVIDTAFAMDFVLQTVSLINALLNSFQVLEERVRFRNELECVFHFNQTLNFVSDILLTMTDNNICNEIFSDDVWLERMEENYELYKAVKVKDGREAVFNDINVSSPRDLFQFLDEHCIEDGFLNEFTHILQCLASIPRNALHLWTNVEKVVNYATAVMRKKHLIEIRAHGELKVDEEFESKSCVYKLHVSCVCFQIICVFCCILVDDAFPSFAELKVMIGRYDNEISEIEVQNKQYKKEMEAYAQQISDLKSKLKYQVLMFNEISLENEILELQKIRLLNKTQTQIPEVKKLSKRPSFISKILNGKSLRSAKEIVDNDDKPSVPLSPKTKITSNLSYNESGECIGGRPYHIRGKSVRKHKNNNKLQFRKAFIIPNTEMRNLHWRKIPLTEINNTVWDGMDDKDIKIDVQLFEQTFSLKTNNMSTNDNEQQNNCQRKNTAIHLIDDKRSYSVDIGLSRFKLSHKAIKDAILSMDESVFNSDKLKRLQRLIPTKTESDILRNFNGDITLLANTESFFLMLSDIPDLEDRLKLWQFKLSFPEQLQKQSTQMEILRSAHDSVRNSASFKMILKYILAHGNYMNGTTNKGQAYGFKLQSLKQVICTKSTNNQQNLLEYIIIEIEKNEKSSNIIDMFLKDFSILDECSKVDVSQLNADMKQIRENLSNILTLCSKAHAIGDDVGNERDLFYKIMNQFYNISQLKYNIKLMEFQNILRDCKILGEYFNCGSSENYTYFADLNSFAKQFYLVHERVLHKISAEKEEMKRLEVKMLEHELMSVMDGNEGCSGYAKNMEEEENGSEEYYAGIINGALNDNEFEFVDKHTFDVIASVLNDEEINGQWEQSDFIVKQEIQQQSMGIGKSQVRKKKKWNIFGRK